MRHIFKWMGTEEQARELWENREALEKYLAALKEFWDEEKQCWKSGKENGNLDLPATAAEHCD